MKIRINPIQNVSEGTNLSPKSPSPNKSSDISKSVKFTSFTPNQWLKVINVSPPLTQQAIGALLPSQIEALSIDITAPNKREIHLLKIQLPQGSFDVLSNKQLVIGDLIQVSINQNHLQLQALIKEPSTFTLDKMITQYQSQQVGATSILLSAANYSRSLIFPHHDTSSSHVVSITTPTSTQSPSLSGLLFTIKPSLPPLPNNTIRQNQVITEEIIKDALSNTGQLFEKKLSTSTTQLTDLSETIKPEQKTFNRAAPNIKKTLKMVAHQIQSWAVELGIKNQKNSLFEKKVLPTSDNATNNLVSSSRAKGTTNNSANNSNNNTSIQIGVEEKAKPRINSFTIYNSKNQSGKLSKANHALGADELKDIKQWLVKTQFSLLTLIGNNSNITDKSKQKIDNTMKLLFPSKFTNNQTIDLTGDIKDIPLVSKKLSFQPFLFKILTQITQSEGQSTQIKQLLNVTQNIIHIQHDQISNKSTQVQYGDQLDLQLSLPFLQGEQLRWCSIECNRDIEHQLNKGKKLGWHLILRFDHDTSKSFAIEANLLENHLSVALWSNQTERLKTLHRHIELFQNKLVRSGFNCDEIVSKRGMPPKNKKQMQQSLVDIRT